jgi:amino acid adenylation domain-containing protein
MTDPERIAMWNATEAVYPLDRSLPELVAAQAAESPEALAIADGHESLTYADLDARASRLSRHLAALGAGPETLVAVVLPRSAGFVVAALAALRAGAAYAPLDPATPPDRLADMLGDAAPRAVVTLDALAGPAGDWTVVTLDGDRAAIARRPATPPGLAGPAPSSLAYVIYTSGSTGRPKGVEVTHASLLNLVFWHQEAFKVTAADRATLMASPGFDAAVWEVWPYLAAGASLHVPDDVTRVDAEALRDWLVAEDITIAFVATPLAERMIGLSWPPAARLRTLLTGADTLHHRPSPMLPFALVNNYGPTECAVVATSGVVEPDLWAGGLPSIGRPIANTRVWVLDEAGRPAPVGAEGELFIGGAGVARGYRHRPGLTAERFGPDPFGPPGARLYRTGDRARWRPDGTLAFLGRSDDQVKIRGHRVELDEIVAVLATHPGVRAAAVAVPSGDDGDRRLVAYVVAAPDVALTPAALLETLRARLPDYMLPATFVRLDRLPLTANGKVGRAALPRPEAAEVLRDPEFIAPRTAVEQRLAAIVAGLLGAERVSVADNFFLLGGHSLLGTQLIARVRDAFGVDVPLRTLFDHPTVAALGAEVEQAILAKVEAA